MATVHPRQPYLPEIDGLRALAVLSVVIFHAFPQLLPGGFVGVDIFFVISGYLITSLLRSEWEANGSIDIAAFYARRVRRILPMLVTIVLITTGAVALLLDAPATHETASAAAAALLFAANVYFQASTGGYFDPATDKLPLLHLWSLGVEEQFYLLWPLALGMLMAKGRAFRWVLVAAVVSGLLAAAMCLLDPNAAFYMMPTRFWELAAGGLIALGSAKAGRGAAWAGLVLMLAAIGMPTDGLAAINVVLGTAGAALLIWTVHGRGALGAVGVALRSGPVVFVGLISYSLYLWHWPLLAIARALHAGPVPAPVLAGLCAAALVLSWLSYRFIERPIRQPRTATPNRRLVGASLLMCVSLASFSWTVATAIVEPYAIPAAANGDPLAAAAASDHPRDSCRFIFNDQFDVFPKTGCGRRGDRPAVVIWGDSHAWAMGPFAAEVAKHEGLQWIGLTRDACPPALGYNVNRTRPVEAEKCRRFNELAAAQIKKADIVVMVGNWAPYPDREDLLKGVAESVAQVSTSARRVILMGPSPALRDTVPRCIESKDAGACDVPRAEFEQKTAGISAGLAEIAKRFPNVTYLSRTDFFCTKESCSAMRDGYGLYWDAHHPSSTAARAFGQEFLTAAQ